MLAGRWALVLGVGLAGCFAASGRASEPKRHSHQGRAQGFAAVVDENPLELARRVDVLGDRAVLNALALDANAPERLAAIRAAAWMRAPEWALEPLVVMLRGRDAEVATAAARALQRIASRIDADTLAMREVMPSDLAPVRAQLAMALGDALLAPDLALVAALIDQHLKHLGVPSG